MLPACYSSKKASIGKTLALLFKPHAVAAWPAFSKNAHVCLQELLGKSLHAESSDHALEVFWRLFVKIDCF